MKRFAILCSFLSACGGPSQPGTLRRAENPIHEAPEEIRTLIAQLEAVARAPAAEREAQIATLEALALEGDAAEAQRSCAAMHRGVLLLNGTRATTDADPQAVFTAQQTCRSSVQRVLVQNDLPLDAIAVASLPPIDLMLQGELTDTDPLVEQDQSPHDDYLVLLEKDWRVRVEMRSEDFDTFLWLIGGAQSESLIQDDDGLQEGTNSLIEYVAADRGLFVVRANSFDTSGRGDYELHIVAPAVRTQ